MLLKELKANARKVLGIPDTVGEFGNRSFRTRGNGAPLNKASVKEVRRSSQYAYKTIDGPKYSGETVVLCRETGARDANGRTIYLTPEGIVFVYIYDGGSPSRLDHGALEAPTFE